MDRKYLKLRKETWYARLKVPRTLRSIVGTSEIVRSLHTRDLGEADRRKHAALAEMYAELERIESKSVMPLDSAKALVATARELAGAVTGGRATRREADLALQIHLREQASDLDVQAQAVGTTPAQIVERTLMLARRTLRGGRVYRISKTIRTYLAERAPHVTNQTLEQKEKQLGELADWMGSGTEVTTLTREQAGRYVQEKLLTKGNSLKTVKDTLSHLRAFWGWLAGRGIVEVNVFEGISHTLRGSTRGKAARRRPWTDAELRQLLLGIPSNDPLWALCAIGAYTGMRREEICQLTRCDVTEDGGLIVREGKTAAAVRRLPIHPVLVPLIRSLMETSTDGYLICGLLRGGRDHRRGHYLSKRFTKVRRKLGLRSSQTVFHCFRKSLAQRCEDKGVPESTTELIGGWSRGRRMSYGLYSPGPSFETLRESISRVSYGEVDGLVRSVGARVKITKVSRRRKIVDAELMAPRTSTRAVSEFQVNSSLGRTASCTP